MNISPYLWTCIISWVVAQGSKYIAAAIKARSLRVFRQLYLSGNMPSAHSATMVSITTLIGLKDGLDSAIFGLAVVVASVVMYDAIMVRRSVGEQGLAIQEIIKIAKHGIVLPRAAKGHTPLEVLVGAILGLFIGSVVFLATK